MSAATTMPLEHDDGWTVREDAFDAAGLLHQETVFTIGNGSFCLRGSFEEGHPGQHPASFMHRVWDDMPVAGTELANLPRWAGIDVWVDGDRVGLDRGELLGYSRALNLRDGVLTRRVSWRAGPDAAVLDLVFERLVDADAPHAAAVRVTASAARPLDLRLRAGLDAHVDNTGLVHWDVVDRRADPTGVAMRVRARATRIEVAAVARIVVEGAGDAEGVACDAAIAPAVDHRLRLEPGARVTLTKYVALVPDLDAEDPAAEATATAGALAARGWDAVRAANAATWALRWAACDVVIEGDAEAQLAVRYNLFQLHIAAPRFTDRASIGAKTLSGFGYRHHVFWDTELFMLVPFSYTEPAVARSMLAYRHHGLPGARAKAAANGYAGAQFSWESAGDGTEVTPAWVQHHADPGRLVRIWTGDIEIHITADIAYAVLQYWRVSGDDAFLADRGAEIILDGAAFWASAARPEDDGRYHYRDVVGPDEYHERVDDNAYTNYLARWHLTAALDVWSWLAEHSPDRAADLARRLGCDDEERASWRRVADGLHLPLDPATGLVEQFDGYFGLTDADVALMRDPARTASMQQLYGIEETNRTQVLKQPDVLMLQYLLPEAFTDEQLRANYAYYDPRTDHEQGSSLGPAISAIMACRAGEPDVGYAHFMRAARADLLDVRGNASDGVHGASAGGLWQAVVFGFAGLRLTDGGFTTSPMLPRGWRRLSFTFSHRGERHTVALAPGD